MKKYFVLIIITFFCLNVFSQNDTDIQATPNTHEDVKNEMSYMEGDGLIEDWFLTDFLEGYKKVAQRKYVQFVGIGVVIAGLLALIYFFNLGYKMLTKNEWDVLALLKPFAIALILFNWVSFVELIEYPFGLITTAMSTEYQKDLKGIDEKRIVRTRYRKMINDISLEYKVETTIVNGVQQVSMTKIDEADLSIWEQATNYVTKPIMKKFYEWNRNFDNWKEEMMQTVGLFVVRLSVYLIFTLQVIFTVILAMIGPFALAFSLTPWFSDSFKTWLGRFISVQFYGILCFVILQVCTVLITSGLEREIDRYSQIVNLDDGVLKNESALGALVASYFGFWFVILAYFICAIAIFTVPKISQWVISSAGTAGGLNGGAAAIGFLGGKASTAGKAVGKSLNASVRNQSNQSNQSTP